MDFGFVPRGGTANASRETGKQTLLSAVLRSLSSGTAPRALGLG